MGLPDPRTVLSVFVLVMNCIHDSGERGYARRPMSATYEIRLTRFPPHSDRHALVATSIGIRVCASILDKLEGLLDLSEREDETKVFELG